MHAFNFISMAYADNAPAQTGSALISFLPIILIFVVFYFLVIRPQSKRMKAHKEKIQNIEKGNTVVTAGGIIAKVIKIEGQDIIVDAGDNVRLRLLKSTIAEVISVDMKPQKEADKKAS